MTSPASVARRPRACPPAARAVHRAAGTALYAISSIVAQRPAGVRRHAQVLAYGQVREDAFALRGPGTSPRARARRAWRRSRAGRRRTRRPRSAASGRTRPSASSTSPRRSVRGWRRHCPDGTTRSMPCTTSMRPYAALTPRSSSSGASGVGRPSTRRPTLQAAAEVRGEDRLVGADRHARRRPR